MTTASTPSPPTGSAGPAPAGTPEAGLRTASPSGVQLTLGPGTPSVAEAEVIRLVNVERKAVGCQPVAVSPLLVQVARAHSQAMSEPGRFRHNSADGRTPFQRLTAVGYRYSIAAENIAAGQPNAPAVMAAWLASPEHRTNMLDCQLTQIGVGVVNVPGSQYRTYWTQDLATPM